MLRHPLVWLALLVSVTPACGDDTKPGKDTQTATDTAATDTAATDETSAETAVPETEVVAETTPETTPETEVEVEVAPPVCDPLPTPSQATVWLDDVHVGRAIFTDSDLVFDGEGRAISVDHAGNLMRRAHDGTQDLWLAHIVANARGLAYLSTGELIVADGGRGLLLAVYPNDEVRTLVSNLDAPGGLDVDDHDHIFVTELTRAAIDEIDPKTGQKTTLVVGLRFTPQGLAFAPDFQTLYVTGNDGGLYALARATPSGWGPLQLVARLPAAVRPCDGKVADDTCDTGSGEATEPLGRCVDDDGELACVVIGPCTGKQIGDACEDPNNLGHEAGTCQDFGGFEFFCVPRQPCDGLAAGDACVTDDVTGECVDDGFGTVYCVAPGLCDGKAAGDRCGDETDASICQELEGELVCAPPAQCRLDNVGAPCNDFEPGHCAVQDGFPYCRVPQPCDDKTDGDDCAQFGTPGICRTSSTGVMACRTPDACDGLALGDSCDYFGTTGRCQDFGDGFLTCYPVPACDGKVADDPCVEWGTAGICSDDGSGGLFCQSVPPCDGKVIGDACSDWNGAGHCADDGTGGLWCQPVDPCEALAVGDACVTFGQAGTCQEAEGRLACVARQPCDGKQVGDVCDDVGSGTGLCSDTLQGYLGCQANGACDGLLVGDACQDWFTGAIGTCGPTATSNLLCSPTNACQGVPVETPCVVPWSGEGGHCQTAPLSGLAYCRPTYCIDGEACTTSNGEPGLCAVSGGIPACFPHDPCEGLADGGACKGLGGASGLCVTEGNGLRCVLDSACNGLTAGAACVHGGSQRPGVCTAAAGDKLVCQPAAACAGLAAGDSCQGGRAQTGTCVAERDGALRCAPDVPGGDSIAIEVDGCGNVYLADAHTQALWRVPTSGTSGTSRGGNAVPDPNAHPRLVPEFVAELGAGPVTGLAFGPDASDWDAQSLYLSGGASVSRVVLGAPGRPIVRALTTDARPAGPAIAPAVDCLNLPSAPTLVTELGRPVGYHDVAFDKDGFIIGYDETNLVAVDHDDHVQLFAAGLNGVQGLDWLPDGSLVVATDTAIVRIFPNGGQAVLAPDISAYGVTVGPDGLVYVADNDRVRRIDPESGEVSDYVVPALFHQSWRARLVAFDPDASLMYIAANGDSVYVVSLDANLDPIGRPRPLALIQAGASFLDALGVDACGNLYIPNYETSALYRVSPDGHRSLYYQWDFDHYGHGLEWGSGIGGWRSDAMYLPQPYDTHTVIELVVGAPTGRPALR